MPHPEYQRHPVTKEPLFTKTPRVALLARTQSVLPPDEFNEEQWQALNAATTIAGQSARTCYAKDLITPLDYVAGSDKHRQTTDQVVRSTREAGHLSTRQHVYYLFALEGVSRNLIYRVLHSYPFHNSDQVSQRYTPMSEEGLVLPLLENESLNENMQEAARQLVAGYHQLTEILTPVARDLYLKRFPKRNSAAWQKRVDSEALKKAQEVGRYLLPLGMGANLYHSVSALTLMRYHRLCQTYPIQPEAHLVIQAMVDQIAAVDPSFLSEAGGSLSPDNVPPYYSPPDYNLVDSDKAGDEIDDYLNGSSARLDLSGSGFSQRLAMAVRLTLGLSEHQLTDEKAISLALDPSKNRLLASVNGEITMDQLSQALNQVYLSATVSLSHSADSQLQRHRGFAHTQPLHLPIPRLDRDIVIPKLLYYSPEALDLYRKMQGVNIQYLKTLADSGVDIDTLAYLQTNGIRIRKRITGPLGAFDHWIKIRTCLTAQEEIYGLAVAIARQLPQLDPILASHFDKPAPCGVRQKAAITPLCPEGDRYCGVSVWKKIIADYPERNI